MMTFNSILGGLIFFLAAGSVARMDKNTAPAIRAAMLGLLAGGLGQVIGYFFKEWDHYLDTILYGAVIAVMLANCRAPLCIAAEWAPRLSIAVCISIVAIVTVAVSF